MSKNSFLIMLSNKALFLMFLFGKILRFVLFAGFLFFLVSGTKEIAGYDINQVIFFFLTFNIIDVFSQFLFREVYRFRNLIVTGDFDLVLVKPFSSLFRSLLGSADFGDLLTIPPLIFATYFVGTKLNPSFSETIFYVILLFNGFIIATAFHISVLALGILTTEIDHTILIYRDLTNLGRFPIDIYKQPLQSIITFLIPVGIMIASPTKALFGLLSIKAILFAFLLGVVSINVSLRFWHRAIRSYVSASS